MTRQEYNRRKYTSDSDYMDLELHRLRMREIRKKREMEKKRAIKQMIIGTINTLILTVCLVSLVMVDSESWIPSAVFFVTLVYLTVYAAYRGVLR